MTWNDQDLRALWRRRSMEVGATRSACLSEKDWERLMANEADAAERARAAGHIATCTDCAEEYRLLQPLHSWADEARRLLDPGPDRRPGRFTGWRAWLAPPRAALALAAASALVIVQGTALYRLRVEGRQQIAALEGQLARQTSALSSAQASVATLEERLRTPPPVPAGEELTTLRQRLAELSTPQLDAAIVDVDPQGAGVVRGSNAAQIVTAVSDAPLVTLILNFAPLASRSTLEVEVVDERDQARWAGRIQRDRDTASLNVTLPRQGYPSGAYAIRVFDVTGARKILATYPVTIRYAATPTAK
jgi:hypothetical protein